LLGYYKNFPENVHATALFGSQEPVKEVQQAIVWALYQLNSETVDLGAVTPYMAQQCTVSFEVGVADGYDFNFLDRKELERCLGQVTEKRLQYMDFFFVARYHVNQEGKRVPLRFDYHVLRFSFFNDKVELRIRHERGTQRLTLDDLTRFLAEKLSLEMSRRGLLPLLLEGFEKTRIV